MSTPIAVILFCTFTKALTLLDLIRYWNNSISLLFFLHYNLKCILHIIVTTNKSLDFKFNFFVLFPDSAAVVLALRTLGAFDFEGHSLLQFVRHCADNYLHSEDKLGKIG